MARHDEGYADKGFRKGDTKGDGKYPIGMGAGRGRDPDAPFVREPVKKLKHAGTFSWFEGFQALWDTTGPAAPGRDSLDIFLLQQAAISEVAR